MFSEKNYEFFALVLRAKIIVAELEQGLVLAPGASDYPQPGSAVGAAKSCCWSSGLGPDQAKHSSRKTFHGHNILH